MIRWLNEEMEKLTEVWQKRAKKKQLRLSKLQHWILLAAYRAQGLEDGYHKVPNGFLPREHIYEGYYGLKKQYLPTLGVSRYTTSDDKRRAKSAYAAVANSLKNLKKKGLVNFYYFMHYYEINYPAEMIEWKWPDGYIALTEKGKTLIIKRQG